MTEYHKYYDIRSFGEEMKTVLDKNLISLRFDLRRNFLLCISSVEIARYSEENFFESQISAGDTEQKTSLEVKSQQD